MHESVEKHRPLCAIELIAHGHAERCPGEECSFWEHGCVLARIETELEHRQEVAGLLLELRGKLERGRSFASDDARATLVRILNSEERIDTPQ